MLKRIMLIAAVFAAGMGVAGAAEVLKVAASAVPHAEILEFVKPMLKAQGVDLQIRVFTDYIQPNLQVEEKQLDANFFQHKPYSRRLQSRARAAISSRCRTAASTSSPSAPIRRKSTRCPNCATVR